MHTWTHYIVIPMLIILFMMLGRLFTQKGMDWYQLQQKPDMTPPGWVFSLAWTIIFICFAASWIIFNKRSRNNTLFWYTNVLYAVSLIFNTLWSYLYFYQHMVMWAFVDAIILTAIIWSLIIITWHRVKISAYLLLPYGLWLLFALYLNYLLIATGN
jgi:translocator protein